MDKERNQRSSESLSLEDLRRSQHQFDVQYFSGADNENAYAKRRHISFHLGILVGKLLRVEELADHGIEDSSVVSNEVIPDLLVYAAQLANLSDTDLDEAYNRRLYGVAQRISLRAQDADGSHSAV